MALVAVGGSRTRCLRVMGPAWKPFHSPAAVSYRASPGRECFGAPGET